MTLSIGTNYTTETNNTRLIGEKIPPQKKPSFRAGFIDSCIAASSFIESQGLMGTYVVQDFCGMVVPRVSAGYFRNTNKTGEGNKSFALMEATREVISGPSLFIIPWIILSNVKRFAGKVYEVPISMISDFGTMFEKFVKENPDLANVDAKEAKTKFYDFVFKNIISETAPGSSTAESGFFAERAAKVADLDARKVFVSFAKKRESKKLLSEVNDKIVEMNKKSGKLPEELNTMVMSGSSAGKTVRISDVKNFTALLTDYTEDIFSKLEKQKNGSGFEISKFVKDFNNKAKVGRFALNVSMFTAVVAFFTQIPKLYKSFSKTNPGMKGLIPETDKVEIAKSEAAKYERV